MTDDQADWELLKLANEKGKFGIQLRPISEPAIQRALERGFDEDWWRLIDVTMIVTMPGYFRVFKLTERGQARRKALEAVAGGPASELA